MSVYLCVRAKDNLRPGHPCPHLAARPGDLIDVVAAPHTPGRKVTAPNWWVFLLDGATRETVAKYLAPKMDGDEIIMLRRYKLDATRISPATRTQLEAGVVVTVSGEASATALLQAIVNKDTGESAQEEGAQPW